MKPILDAVSSFMMIYGSVLIILSLAYIPVLLWDKKRPKPFNKTEKMWVNISMFTLAFMIALPVQLLFFSGKRQSKAQQFVASLPTDANGQVILHHNYESYLSKPKPQVDPAERERLEAERKDAKAERERLEAERDARRAQDRLEQERERAERQRAFEERVARQKREHEERVAEMRRKSAEAAAERERRRAEEQRFLKERGQMLEAMSEAGVYKPPFDESTTQAQRDLDAKIIAANVEYQTLRTERERVDQARQAARDEFSAAVRAKPTDRKRIDAAKLALRESMSLQQPSYTDISRAEQTVTKLVLERFDAQYEKQ